MTEASAEVPPPGRIRHDVRPRRTLGFALAFGGALLFAVNGSVSKITLQAGVDSLSLVLLRSAGAAVCLLVLVLVTDRTRLRLHKAELPLLLVYGLVGIAMVQWLYFVAIARLPIGVALLLEFTGPVLVALWARFVQKQQLGRSLWLALALALCGLALVAEIWDGLSFDAVGVLAGFGAAISLATYYIAGKHALVKRDTVSLAFWAFLVSAAFWSLAKPWWTVPWDSLSGAVELPGALDQTTVTGWGLIAWVVLLGTVAPFLMVITALRHLAATEAGVAGMVEPVLAGAVAWVWLDETLTVIQVTGSLVVIAGIAVAQRATASTT
ncbi:MAG: EamA family transporter [Actinomycetia bacterium]|nr:EamA family transporter [Actinomycetes bacterium]